MNKLNKVALTVAAILSSQAYAGNAGKFDVEVYGKLGAATQLDADENESISDRLSDDFKIYEDTKAGVKLGYGITNDISVHTEIKTDFQGEDLDVRIQELYVKGELDQFEAKLGRVRTPLYMNSTIQDDDFKLHSYRGVRFFDTARAELETVDAVSIGLKEKMQAGKFELNALVGEAKDRDFEFSDSGVQTETTYESENVWLVRGQLASQFGKFHLGHLEADTGKKDSTLVEFKSTSFGYAYDSGTWFVDAEIAREKEDEVDTDKYYGTVGYSMDKLTPSLTYVESEEDGSEKQTSIEFNIGYDVTDNVKFKTSFEKVDMGSYDDDIFSLGLAFKL